MATIRQLMEIKPVQQAISDVMFGEEHQNRKCIEHFLRSYEGSSPYFAFILKNVSRSDTSLFLASGLDYAPFDAELMSIKANLPAEEEPTDTATQTEGV
jgi:hypothetical protein